MFSAWLKGSRLAADDALLVFSVGGGDVEQERLGQPRRERSSSRGRSARRSSASSGATAATPRRLAEACVVIPPLFADRITPHTEGLCAVVWHLLVSHPALQPARRRRWEVAEVTAAMRRVRHRRWRGLHRQPLRRAPARRRRTSSAVTVYDNFSSGRRWHLAAVADDPRLAVVEGDVQRPRRAVRGRGGSRRGDPPRLEPGHRGRRDEPGHRLRRGHPAHPPRGRGRPPGRGRPRPLRLGQRRLRRPRRARGAGGPRADGAGLHLRREQAGRRGADLSSYAPCST